MPIKAIVKWASVVLVLGVGISFWGASWGEVAVESSREIWNGLVFGAKMAGEISLEEWLLGLGLISIGVLPLLKVMSLVWHSLKVRDWAYLLGGTLLLLFLILALLRFPKPFGYKPIVMNVEDLLSLALLSVAPGLLGGILGIGGGIILLPILSWLQFPIALASGISAASVIGSSSSSRSEQTEEYHLLTRLGLANVVGAFVGTYLASIVPGRVLYALLGGTLLLIVGFTWRRNNTGPGNGITINLRGVQLHLSGWRGRQVLAMCLMVIAGILSGILGIGGGPFYLIIINKILKMDVTEAARVSAFLTGCSGFTIFFFAFERGTIPLLVGAIVLLSALCGSKLGRLFGKWLPKRAVFIIYILVLLGTGIQMLSKSFL